MKKSDYRWFNPIFLKIIIHLILLLSPLWVYIDNGFSIYGGINRSALSFKISFIVIPLEILLSWLIIPHKDDNINIVLYIIHRIVLGITIIILTLLPLWVYIDNGFSMYASGEAAMGIGRDRLFYISFAGITPLWFLICSVMTLNSYGKS